MLLHSQKSLYYAEGEEITNLTDMENSVITPSVWSQMDGNMIIGSHFIIQTIRNSLLCRLLEQV